MKKKLSEQENVGTLYLVGTPIGNLEDMTYRGVRVLSEVDKIYCEDTRRTSQLLRHYKIEAKAGLESFHDHSSPKILRKIEALFLENQSVAYVTDAGLPGVSDPGFVLVRAALRVGAPVTVVPGPSAASLVFAASNLPSPKYLFHGFFPRSHGEVERTLELLRQLPVVHIFYEAPGRIMALLEVLKRNVPQAQVVLGRELTKMHEEWIRGECAEVYETLVERQEAEGKIRGEFAVAVHVQALHKLLREEKNAANSTESEPLVQLELTEAQKKEISEKLRSGQSSKDVAKELAKKFRLPKRMIYEFIIRHLT
ncbi:MAG TPA: 16S rRNA (cytidine(1402)-2'-O)-methyltransferase [Oligoflexia bacterium]|nr:16S rRNA (cytidine(1402)-2'-O)-methyltransferase [Oligoflexia bacterium]